MHVIGEDRGAAGRAAADSSMRVQVVAVEDVVAEDERARLAADEIAAEDEGLRQAVGARLHAVAESRCPTASRRRAAPGSAACPAAC